MEEVEIDKKDQINFSYILRLPLVILSCSLIGLMAMVLLLNPDKGPVVVILFLINTLLFFTALNVILIQLVLKFLRLKNFTGIRLFYTSVMIAIGLTFVIGLQTLNQLQIVDIVLVSLFEIVVFFYMGRRFS